MQANKPSGMALNGAALLLLLTTGMPVQAQLSVSPSGQASYVYPLAVPPLRGHEPSL